jgi:hypothetical protein
MLLGFINLRELLCFDGGTKTWSVVMSSRETDPIVLIPETSDGFMMLFSRSASSSLSSPKSVFELSN